MNELSSFLSLDEGKNIGQRLDFAKMNNLEYLDMVIHETVRMHPTVPILWRVCTKGPATYDISKILISPTLCLQFQGTEAFNYSMHMSYK